MYKGFGRRFPLCVGGGARGRVQRIGFRVWGLWPHVLCFLWQEKDGPPSLGHFSGMLGFVHFHFGISMSLNYGFSYLLDYCRKIWLFRELSVCVQYPDGYYCRPQLQFVLVSEVVLLVASFVDFPTKQSSRRLCVISSVVKALNQSVQVST